MDVRTVVWQWMDAQNSVFTARSWQTALQWKYLPLRELIHETYLTLHACPNQPTLNQLKWHSLTSMAIIHFSHSGVLPWDLMRCFDGDIRCHQYTSICPVQNFLWSSYHSACFKNLVEGRFFTPPNIISCALWLGLLWKSRMPAHP